MDLKDYLIRMCFALIVWIVIGIEREVHSKSAGLKTNALVSIGSCIFVMLSLEFRGEDFVDTTRVLSQIVIGIGFIGGGVILHTTLEWMNNFIFKGSFFFTINLLKMWDT